MNILIDLRPLQSGKISGVEVCTENIVRELIEQGFEHRFFLWTNSSQALPNKCLKFIKEMVYQKQAKLTLGDTVKKVQHVYHIHTNKPNKLLNFSLSYLRFVNLDELVAHEAKKEGFLTKNEHFDIVFFSDLRPASVSSKVKKYIFVHDLSFLHYPSNFSFKTRLWYSLLRVKKELQETHHIFVPSKFTKNDLIDSLKLPKEKILVISEGVKSKFCPVSKDEKFKIKSKYSLPDKFILSLCSLEPRKNLERFIKAFESFNKKHLESDLVLVIAGQKDKKMFSKLNLSHPQDVIFTGFIPESDKVALMSTAWAFTFPSIFEGFGLPILEAMACGTPVMTSNIASMPEITDKCAILFDPMDEKVMMRAIEVLFFDEYLRSQLSVKSIARARKFTWSKVGEKILKVFDSTKND